MSAAKTSKAGAESATSPAKSAAAISRQTILDTAARLFRQEGYAATSLRSIAQACDMKAGSLYYHFESKDQIVSEVLDIGVHRVFDTVKTAVNALPLSADLTATLQCAIEAHLGALLHAHDFTSANIRIFGQVPDEVRASHKSLRKKYEQYWQDLLIGLQQRGEIRLGVDLQRTVFFLFGAMNWTTEWYDEKKSDLVAMAGELTDLVTNGLWAKPFVGATRTKTTLGKSPPLCQDSCRLTQIPYSVRGQQGEQDDDLS